MEVSVIRQGLEHKEVVYLINLPRLAKPQNLANGHTTMHRIQLPIRLRTLLPAREQTHHLLDTPNKINDYLL